MDATIWVAIIMSISAVAVAIINAYFKEKEIKREAEKTRQKIADDKKEYDRVAAEAKEGLAKQNEVLDRQNETLARQSRVLDAQNLKLDEIIAGNEELKEGTMQLLGSEIDRVYFKYKGKDSIPLSEYENIKQVFEIYDKLGGNGVRKKHWIQIDHLPVVNDEE